MATEEVDTEEARRSYIEVVLRMSGIRFETIWSGSLKESFLGNTDENNLALPAETVARALMASAHCCGDCLNFADDAVERIAEQLPETIYIPIERGELPPNAGDPRVYAAWVQTVLHGNDMEQTVTSSLTAEIGKYACEYERLMEAAAQIPAADGAAMFRAYLEDQGEGDAEGIANIVENLWATWKNSGQPGVFSDFVASVLDNVSEGG